MANGFTDDDDALLAELGIEVEAKKEAARTPREERIIAGFEEIQRFVVNHGRAPRHGEDRDIFERLYAVRLDRLRAQADCRALLEPLDDQGLLLGAEPALADAPDNISDDELLAQLGVDAAPDDITELRHVRSVADKRAAEEIANRERCEDFDRFKPLFDAVQNEIDTSVRITQPIRKDAGFLKTDIRAGEFFILGGQIAYVAEVGEPFKAPNGESDARLRVIYSNGTESNLLLRSLQRALYKDDASRRVSDPSAGPLFAGETGADDLASGTIYVLRSKSDNPIVAANREILHKIGVTGGDVTRRIANAKLDPTFLMADVEIVATYTLYNINRVKLEKLIHRIFDPARLDIQINDRFGNPIVPREWFLVPGFVVDDAVERIKDGTITNYIYDPRAARLVYLGKSDRSAAD
ncbi:MAG: GIY-YIG nuclease family protein [Sphingomonadaceae bacterium]